jgi:hypothetical protein
MGKTLLSHGLRVFDDQTLLRIALLASDCRPQKQRGACPDSGWGHALLGWSSRPSVLEAVLHAGRERQRDVVCGLTSEVVPVLEANPGSYFHVHEPVLGDVAVDSETEA